MGSGSEVEKHHFRGQHDLDGCTTLCLVRRIINAISKVGFVTTEDLNPSGSVGSSNVAARSPGIGPRVGSLGNPSVGPKFVFGDIKVKTQPDAVFRNPRGSMVHKVQKPGTR